MWKLESCSMISYESSGSRMSVVVGFESSGSRKPMVLSKIQREGRWFLILKRENGQLQMLEKTLKTRSRELLKSLRWKLRGCVVLCAQVKQHQQQLPRRRTREKDYHNRAGLIRTRQSFTQAPRSLRNLIHFKLCIREAFSKGFSKKPKVMHRACKCLQFLTRCSYQGIVVLNSRGTFDSHRDLGVGSSRVQFTDPLAPQFIHTYQEVVLLQGTACRLQIAFRWTQTVCPLLPPLPQFSCSIYFCRLTVRQNAATTHHFASHAPNPLYLSCDPRRLASRGIMSLRQYLGYSEGELMRHTAGIFTVSRAFGFWILCRLHYGLKESCFDNLYATCLRPWLLQVHGGIDVLGFMVVSTCYSYSVCCKNVSSGPQALPFMYAGQEFAGFRASFRLRFFP